MPKFFSASAFLLGFVPLLAADLLPQVLAHRGGSALRPQNTIAAFRHALELGVQVLEFDMNLTADDQIVIHHDSTINPAVCRPESGSDVRPGPIRKLTLAQIRHFECGNSSAPGERMPTLDEFLEAVSGSKAQLLGETKMPPSDSGSTVDPAQFVKLIDEAVRRHNSVSRFVLQSADYQTIDAMKAVDPGIQLCLLNARQLRPAYLDVARKHGATYLMLRADDITAEQVSELHSAGLKIYSGTANTEEDWRKYVALRMDGILTDDPARLIRFLANSPIDRMYVFGDSYSDTGAGYVDGDGPTAVGYLAQFLRLDLVPANASVTKDRSLNFAVSGAGTGSGSGRKVKDALLGLGMENQVKDFAGRMHSGAIRFDPESTLFFIAGGLNDRRLPAETTIANLKAEINTLYGLGARRFSIALLPAAIPGFSEMGVRLNPMLSRLPDEVRADLPGAKISVSHWGSFFDEVMRTPGSFGIRNTTDKCAGRAIFDEDTTPCANPAEYFYYHAGHPSTAVHKIVGQKLYEELTGNKVP